VPSPTAKAHKKSQDDLQPGFSVIILEWCGSTIFYINAVLASSIFV